MPTSVIRLVTIDLFQVVIVEHGSCTVSVGEVFHDLRTTPFQ